MSATIDQLAARLRKRITLDREALDSAQHVWLRLRNAIVKGCEDQKIPSRTLLRDRYLSILRYCDDSDELVQRFFEYEEAEGGGGPSSEVTKIIPVIDTHLLYAYSDFWDDAAHKGFAFLEKELGLEKKQDREKESVKAASPDRDFQLFVYQSLLRQREVAVLEAGHADISKMVAYFGNQANTPGHAKRPLGPQAAATKLAEALEGLLEDLNPQSAAIPMLADQFEKLVDTLAIPELLQSYRLARLVGLLKRGKFYGPEMLLRRTFDKNADDVTLQRIANFDRLRAYLRNHPSITSDSLNAMLRAYKLFRVSSSLDGAPDREPLNLRDEFPSQDRREGEVLDVRALHEIHVLNACADVVGLDVRFRYITLSTRMFNFARAFDKASLFVRLSHPRTAIVMDTSAALRKHFHETAVPIAAAGESIPKDDRITSHELTKFDNKVYDALLASRSSFAFDIKISAQNRVQDKHEKFGIILDAMRSIFERGEIDPILRDDGIKLVDEFTAFLPRRKAEIFEAFEEVSSKLGDNAWDTYFQFTRQLKGSNPPVLVRRVEPSIRGGMARYTCIPLAGGYRHMFVLHNSIIEDQLSDVLTEPQIKPMGQLLSEIEAACKEAAKKSDASGKKARASRYFIRAIYASVDREWMLAHTLSSLALEEIANSRSLLHDKDEVFQARLLLIEQEVLFFRHLARRALAEASAPGRRVDNWLRRAGQDLAAAAEILIKMNGTLHQHDSAVNPVSIRIALAALGLAIEWRNECIGVEEDYGTPPPLKLQLPESMKKEWAWREFPSQDIGELSFGEIAKLTLRVVADCADEFHKLSKANEVALAEHATMHNGLFWRFLLIRANQIRLTALTAASNLVSSAGVQFTFEPSELDKAEELLKAHDDDARHLINQHNKTAPNALKIAPYSQGNHFMAGLIEAMKLTLAVEKLPDSEGSFLISNMASAMISFGKIDNACSRLNRFGFPRSMLRKVKEKYAGSIRDELNFHYDLR